MMSESRILKAILVSCLAIAQIGGNAYTLSSGEDADATMTSSGFLYSVNIMLDEATSPLVLGIRNGQTAAQVGLRGLPWEGRSCLVVYCGEALRSLSLPRSYYIVAVESSFVVHAGCRGILSRARVG